jgi:flagellar protein FliT
MSNAPQLYTLYQQLLDQSQLMLRLARQGLWDELIACETDYVNAVHSLAQLTEKFSLLHKCRNNFALPCG